MSRLKSDKAPAEGETTPETLRQTDRDRIETLESSRRLVARRRSKAEILIGNFGSNLSGFRTAGVQVSGRYRAQGLPSRVRFGVRNERSRSKTNSPL